MMAKAMHALIYPSAPAVIAERRMIDPLVECPVNKQPLWRPIVKVGDDSFNSLTHKKTGPVTTIEANQVVDTFTITALTAQEISDAKDAEVSRINGTDRKAQLKILLALANDARLVKRKINAVIVATGIATPQFSAAMTTSPANDWTEADLKAYIKGLLD